MSLPRDRLRFFRCCIPYAPLIITALPSANRERSFDFAWVHVLQELSRQKNLNIEYKAFYNQVAKPHFADFARTMAERLIGEMTLKVLGFQKGQAFAEFHHIVIQDGSSFAIHDGLREVFPGRFKAVKPAAVELHTTMDLLCDAPTTVVLTPDTTSEQAFLPEPMSLRDSVLLADRGYVDLHYLRRVQDEGGFFLIRAKAGMNPQVLEAFREDGKRLRSLRNKSLQTIHAKLPKRQRVELGVQWQIDGHPLFLLRN